ncbi:MULTISPECIES: MFS transporter [unclassified Viridibacillus]|uniref:MDR family MFS transporter n=1 Tax=unclassified Viridibacillus TaxID=2617942 RepID=UPI00096ED566|nr:MULTISPECIES: MFS transporter [unclassified Viridibacillus]OMC84679.1 MFS transporter [Viridibacillus sp. FSL H8-0123]OMC86096.1 MFS transporter [Viridibacillus sp. FSL H7-0596]
MKLKDLPQNIKLRLITSFFNRIAFNAVMPFIALFFAHEVNKVFAGSLLLLSVGINFATNLVGGYIADRFRRKKVLLITSFTTFALLFLMTLCLIPNKRLIWLFTALYLIYVVSSNLGRPAMQAIILDSTTAENRKAVFAIDYWLLNLSISFGAILGGLLYMNHQIMLFSFLTVTTVFIAIAYLIWLQDDSIPTIEKQHDNILLDLISNYKTALMDHRFVKLTLGMMFIFSAEFSLSTYISVRLAETFKSVKIFGFEIEGVRMFSLLSFENTLLVVCFTFLVSRWTNTMNNKKSILLGLAVYGLGYTFLTSSNHFYLLLLFGALATLGELMYSPVFQTEQANCIPADKRGSYLALSGLGFNGASMISSGALILGAFLAPWEMSIFIGIIVMSGIALIYSGLFYTGKIRLVLNR